MNLGAESMSVRGVLALFAWLLLPPATAQGFQVSLELQFPSQTVLGSSLAYYDDAVAIPNLAMTATGDILSFDDLLIRETWASAVSVFRFEVLDPVSGTLDPASGAYTSNAFDVQVTKFQNGGTGVLWTDVIEHVVLTTESSFRDCVNDALDGTFYGERLGAVAPDQISLVASACPSDFGGGTNPEFEDAMFFVRLSASLYPAAQSIPASSSLGLVVLSAILCAVTACYRPNS